MRSPCLTCEFKDEDKNNERCENCKKRLEYNVSVGNLPMEVLGTENQEQERDYKERMATVAETEMTLDLLDLKADESSKKRRGRSIKQERGEIKMDDFRNSVLSLSAKGIGIMDEYFEGTRHGTEKVKEASAMIREGVKISNRDQVDAQVKRSQAIRLMAHIPKKRREDYIKFTNPEVAPFLLDVPGKNKK